MTRVVKLDNTDYEAVYSCSPREAVIAAYAQSRGDYNTWDYHKKYDHLVVTGHFSVSCGQFCALIEQK